MPDEFNPQIIIEAKITEDDGTARDKVTRIQHLGQLSMTGVTSGQPRYEVVACIAGRGFGVRREDMRKMLLATRGKGFTLKTPNRLIDRSALKGFETKTQAAGAFSVRRSIPLQPRQFRSREKGVYVHNAGSHLNVAKDISCQSATGTNGWDLSFSALPVGKSLNVCLTRT